MAEKKPKYNKYPFLCPRFWHGMLVSDWFPWGARKFFRMHPIRVPMAAGVCLFTMFNSVCRQYQQFRYGRKIEETELSEPPIFIIGHWRSGTTHLHELMVRNPHWSYPSTYACFVPHHFLSTFCWVKPLFPWLVPNQRPMDNVAIGFTHPQEDEFALCSLGAPSPYRRMAFPNDPPVDEEFLDMQGVREKDLVRWKAALTWFVKALTFAEKKRIVLKSPTHTGRIEVLSQMFPGAKFIHIVRDPYTLFASTKRLWLALDPPQAFQIPKHKDLDEYVLATFERMYGGFWDQLSRIDSANIVNVRYEDLVQDRLGEMQRIYEKLDLGDFSAAEPEVRAYIEELGSYKPNKHPDLSDEIRSAVGTRWARYLDEYGYELQPAG